MPDCTFESAKAKALVGFAFCFRAMRKSFLMPVMMFDMIYFSMLNCCLPITKVKTNKLRGGKIIMNSVEDENRCELHSGLPVCRKNAIAII